MSIITYILGITSSVLAGAILAIYNDNRRLRQSRKEANIKNEKANDDLMLCMGRLLLLSAMRDCVNKGFKTIEDNDSINKMYVAYISSGGNSSVKDYYNSEFKHLKIKSE
jgi:hypothetical protein